MTFAGLILSSCLGQQAAQASPPARTPSETIWLDGQLLSGKDKAYLVSRPVNLVPTRVWWTQVLAGGDKVAVLRSPDGEPERALPPHTYPDRMTLSIANAVHGTWKNLKFDLPGSREYFAEPCGKYGFLLAVSDQSGHMEASFFADGGAESHVFQGSNSALNGYPVCDPVQPYIYMPKKSGEAWVVSRFALDGSPAGQVAMPPGRACVVHRWSDDYIGAVLVTADPNKHSSQHFRLDFDTGHATEVPAPTVWWHPAGSAPPTGELETTESVHTLVNGAGVGKAEGTWLVAKSNEKSREGTALIGTAGGDVWLNGSQTRLLMWREDRLWVSTVDSISKEEFLANMKHRAQMEALNAAKQVGLAALLYGSDHNDEYPSARTFNSDVLPYLKDASLLGGFVYLLNGESASAVANPASTMLGYVDTPYGRATVYADGHAKWGQV